MSTRVYLSNIGKYLSSLHKLDHVVAPKRTSRTRSHNPLNLFVISSIEHIVLRNN
jgi:hypothetical protein